MSDVLLILNILISGGGVAALFIRVGRLLQKVDDHEHRINRIEERFIG